jgi:hypothetical protein
MKKTVDKTTDEARLLKIKKRKIKVDFKKLLEPIDNWFGNVTILRKGKIYFNSALISNLQEVFFTKMVTM